MNQRTMGDALSDQIRQWKDRHPDWDALLKPPARLSDEERVRQRRKQVYQELAALAVTALQRNANEHGMPPRPDMGKWEKFMLSEWMTMNQHSKGQYLPFHERMERLLSRTFESIDTHFLAYKGADTITSVKEGVGAWFDADIRQPASQAWKTVTDRQRQGKRT
jgi:hypothetical protein